MFAMKPRIELTLRILLITAILFGAPLSSSSVQAARSPLTPTSISTAEPSVTTTHTVPPVTETSIPVTQTPIANTETATPVFTQTESPTSVPTTIVPFTATVEPISTVVTVPTLSLSAEPGMVAANSTLTLKWEIAGLALEEHKELLLQITLPDILTPTDDYKDSYDETTRMVTIPVISLTGQVTVTTGEQTSEIVLYAALLEATSVIAETKISLAPGEQFHVDTQGGEIVALDGTLQVEFPAGALPEDAVVQIGAPSTDTMPEYSLSGNPFEITAYAEDNGEEISRFPQELTISVSYADRNIPDEQVGDLALFWYNQESGEWEQLSSMVDIKTKTLKAFTDHFTVFDMDVNNWQAGHIPTVDSFQVSNFTGAATYSLPIEVPAGPGGFQPSIQLNYNSQVVDQSVTISQASWVGMGWSLDTGSIELDSHGTSWPGDDTYTLDVGGISTRLLPYGSAYYATDENFWKITKNASTRSWTVQDKQGNTYYFEHVISYPYQVGACPDPETGVIDQDYRWMLSKMQNMFGQQILYTYTDQMTTVRLHQYYSGTGACDTIDRPSVSASYPSTITYAGGKYRVRYDIGSNPSRLDMPPVWDDTFIHSFKAYERYRLQNIFVEQDLNGDGTFETILRKYQLTYAANTDPDVIFPGFTWAAGGKTSTLRSLQQFGVGGSTSLPAKTFTYGDNLHLTQATNGYGGSVGFTYESTPWYYQPHATKSRVTLYKFGQGGQPCQFGDSAPWSGRVNSNVNCDGNGRLIVKGTAYTPTKSSPDGIVFRPGGVYQVTAGYTLDSGTSAQLGLFDGATDDLSIVNAGADIFILPATASKAEPLFVGIGGSVNSSIRARVVYYKFELLTSVYRVTAKTFNDGNGHTYSYNYSYQGGAVNDTTTSSGVCGFTVDMYGDVHDTSGCTEFFDKFSEFRGNSQVTETAPDGVTKTITNFNQGDVLKGKPSSSASKTGTILISAVDYYYSATFLPATKPSACNVCGAFLGIDRYWVRPAYEIQHIYDNTGSIVASRKTTHTYEATYGNETDQAEYDVSSGSPYRTTHFDFYPNATLYLVGLPARQQIKNSAGTVIAETLNFYDGATTYTTAPSIGKLTATRTWTSGTSYSQVSFGYDTWGNRTSVTSYTGYGTVSSAPTTGAAVNTTVYDTVFHAYPVSQTTPPITNAPAGLTTTWKYDYDNNGSDDFILGVPTRETDPNGNSTDAQYDVFGRMTKLIRPGDSSTSPTISIGYQDSFPFTTTITQKIDSTQSYTVQRVYDGMGRQTRITSGGTIVDTVYQSATVTKQSVPYQGTSPNLFTTTTINPTAHTTTVQAPDGTSSVTYTNGFQATVTDANQHSTTTTSDIWGRTISVVPPTGPSVSYTYDELDRLLTATRGVTTTMTYDNGGRKISMSDPDMGNWSYAYDALGDLTRQTDAGGQRICLYYDALNRLLGKHYRSDNSCPSSPTYNTSYTYDQGTNGKGKRTGMTDASGSTVWVYDTRGRMVSEDKTITGAGTFNTTWTYNSADLPITMRYPDNETVTYNYNNRMLLNSLSGTSTYVSSTTYDPAGRIDLRTFGNTTQTDYTYYPWSQQGGRLQTLKSGTASTPASLQDLSYVYDPVGNVSQINDTIANEKQTFRYDSLDRLRCSGLTAINVTSGCETYNAGNDTFGALTGNDTEYTYDLATGNLKTKGSLSLSYLDQANHTHAVTNAGSSLFAYDPDGNMTTRYVNGQNFSLGYDAENRLASVSASTQSPATPTPSPTPNSTNTPTPTPTSQACTNLALGKAATASANSAQAGQAVDNNLSTLWNALTYPTQSIEINLGGLYTVDGVRLYVAQSPDASTTHEVWVANSSHVYTKVDTITGFTFDGQLLSRTYSGGLPSVQWVKIVTTASPSWVAWREIQVCGSSAATATPTNTPTTTPTNTPTNTPTPTPTSSSSDLIFADGFESGNFSAWSANTNNSGNLSVSTTAAQGGTYGMKINFVNTTNMFVRDDSPTAETRYRARFAIHPNSITMATGDNITLLQGLNASGTVVLSVQLNRSTSYQLRARSYDSGLASWVSTSYVNISNAVHSVEIDWGNDGHLTFWIDGTQQANLTGVNSSSYTIETLRLGAPNMTISGTSGSYYIDAFESRRSTYIGPIAYAPESGPSLAMNGQYHSVAYHLPSPQQNEVLASPNLPAVDPIFSSASFVYDGDGNRVVQTINGVTTYFVGNYYEYSSNGNVTKYYYAGTQRVAMRTGTTLSYVLSDHLGSTSITTNSSGIKISELRYKPWGEVRFTSGTPPTDYTYTGQYSNADDFGLMFYNARWYDPYLNHFTQPDSIVPDPYNSQSYDRYSYVLNNPLRYTDPSGHRACEAEDKHGNCIDLKTSIKLDLESKYKIKIKGGWDEDELLYLSDTLTKFSIYAGGAENLNDVFLDAMQAHNSTADRLTFKNTAGNTAPCSNGGFACWENSDTISFSDFIFTPEYQLMRQKRSDVPLGIQLTIGHEIVHVFADARPAMVGLYSGFVDNPTSINHQPTAGCMNECIYEENMATTIAKYVITGNIRTPDQLKFVLQTQHYWEAWP